MANNSNKEKFIAQAQKLVEKGQFDKAIREYLKVVAEDENDIRIWIRIGDLYVKLGQKNEAVENYKKVATLYVQQGDVDKAIAVYKRILEIAPQTVEASQALGALYREQGHIGHAIHQYEVAAQALYRLGKIRDSLAAEQAIVDMSPDSIARRIKLAEIYSKEKMYSDAAREFSAAAAFLYNAGRLDDYAKVAERLLFHAPNSLEAIKELARHYLKQNDAQRALSRLQGGFKVDQKDPEILDLLSEAFTALGKRDKSVAVLRELARIYTERSAMAAARSVFQRILELEPGNPEARAALSQNPQPRSGTATSEPGQGPLQALILNSPMPQQIPSGPSGGSQSVPLSGLSGRGPSNSLSGSRALTPPTGSALSAMSGKLTPAVGTPLAGLSAMSGQLTPPAGSTISARLTPAVGTQMAAGSAAASPDEEAARLVAEADSFLRFGLAKKAVEHLQTALARNPDLRPVRERLVKLLEAQRDYKGAIAELRVLLGQCFDPQDEVLYLREILRLDNQDQQAQTRLRVITGLHQIGTPIDDDPDEPEISVSTGEESGASHPPASAKSLRSDLASTSEVPVSEFRAYVEKMKKEGAAGSGHQHSPLPSPKPSEARSNPKNDAKTVVQPAAASDGVPEQRMPSADTRPNAAEVEAAAEELALTSGTLKEELDEVDFCLQQKMYDDARRQLRALADRYPHSKTVQAKLKQLENPAAEVVIDVDMADVHEELLLSVAAPHAAAPTPSNVSLPPPSSQVSLSPSGRSLPPEFAQGGSQPRIIQRSLPPPPPRPSRVQKSATSSDASGAFRLGVSYRNQGKYEQAIGEFQKAMQDAKRGARAALLTGLCYRDQSRMKDAVDSFKLGVHMPGISEPDLAELHYQLGRSYEMLADLKEAIHFYQMALGREGRFRDSADRIATLKLALAKQ